MKALRVLRACGATVSMAGVTFLAMGSIPASAQVPDDVVLSIMRECARIDDPTSRLACYDNNIRSGGSDGRAPVVPGENGRIEGSGSVMGRGSGAQGFGSEDIRTPERFDSYEERGLGPDEIRARVEDVSQREPGIYLITLEGGAQWLFTDSVSFSYRAPREGDTIEISRAALSSFLMRFDNQQSVRVRRIR